MTDKPARTPGKLHIERDDVIGTFILDEDQLQLFKPVYCSSLDIERVVDCWNLSEDHGDPDDIRVVIQEARLVAARVDSAGSLRAALARLKK